MGRRVGIAGATGLVGRTMMQVLEERGFEMSSLRLFASSRSAGARIPFRGGEIEVEELRPDSFGEIDLLLFSAGAGVSREFSPIAAEAGAVVVDNSSAFRSDPNVPLVVPEVNAETIPRHQGIIAVPNCSTIQLVLPLKVLDDAFGLRRVIVSTYQSISGAGQSAVDQLRAELSGKRPEVRKFSRTVAFNTIFHSFPEGSDQTEEEMKVIAETRRILDLPSLPIAVTCVRIPTTGGHAESVNVELQRGTSPEEIRRLLSGANGIRVIDSPERDSYPTVLDAEGQDDVLIGRIRRDNSAANSFQLWVVADNLRKGAATNAVQIAERIPAHRGAPLS